MFKNYFKIAWRSLINSKGFSFINISGLAIGMAAAMLIGLWIRHELSFDRFHDRIDNLYVTYNRSVFDGEINCWSTTPAALGPALKQEFPEIKYSVRTDYVDKHLLDYNGKKLEADGFDAEPDFLKMFTFPLILGNINTALNSPYKLIVTETFAKKMFGSSAAAMGKVIKFDNNFNMTVSGVLKKLPANTRFECDFIAPWSFFRVQFSADEDNWGNNSYRTYVELQPHTDVVQLNKKIKNITIRHTNHGEDNQVFLHPFRDYYLHNSFKNGVPAGGRADVVRLFTIIAGLILLIACINFMNQARREAKSVLKK